MPIHGLQADIHEPREVVELLRQSVPTEQFNLNSDGWADYRWQTDDGIIHVERKRWPELLHSVSAIESQLMRQLNAHPDARLILLVEGIVVRGASMVGGTSIVTRTAGKPNIFYSRDQSSITLSAMYAWLYQVSKFMEVYLTPDLETTAMALVAFYTSDQKAEHKTMRRHIKEVDFHTNPQVVSLMGMVPGLGPIKSEALVLEFGTAWNVLSASPQELAKVPGVGVNEARKWLQRIGRPDV